MSSLDPQELQVLDFRLRYRFASTVVLLCVAAIQLFMWTYMASLHREASLEARKRRLPYLIASLFIFLLSCARSIILGVFTYSLLSDLEPGLENYGDIGTAARAHLMMISAIVGDLAIRLADAVLVHRCYVVWFDRPWVTALPASIWLANFGISLRTYATPDGVTSDLNLADMSLSVGLNIIVTILISLRLIRAQKRMEKAFPHTPHKLYLGAVTILVESAAPIAVTGTAYIIAYALSDGWTGLRVALILNIMFNAALLLSPQLVIFRVATGKSWSNRADAGTMLTQPIQFAGSQTRSDLESSSMENSSH